MFSLQPPRYIPTLPKAASIQRPLMGPLIGEHRPRVRPPGRRSARPSLTQSRHWRPAIWAPENRPRCSGLHCRYRAAAAGAGPLIRGALLDTRVIKSSILERNILRIGDVFAL